VEEYGRLVQTRIRTIGFGPGKRNNNMRGRQHHG
jgi:hypothetical protein